MSVSVLNTDAGLSGKTLVNAEDSQTITGLKTFDRDPNAPFAVSAGSAKVDNLDADKLDGDDWTSGVDQIQAGAGSVSAPTYSKNGDSNSGVYFPAADEVALATGGTQALLVDSTQFIDSPTQPRCSLSGASQSVGTGTSGAALSFTTEDFDIGGCHESVTNPTRITVPAGGDGCYLVIGHAAYPSNSTGVRQTFFKKNGTTIFGPSAESSTVGSAIEQHTLSALVNLVAGDYVELFAIQTSGSSLTVTSQQFAAVKLW